jgi:hypothetical protein
MLLFQKYVNVFNKHFYKLNVDEITNMLKYSCL